MKRYSPISINLSESTFGRHDTICVPDSTICASHATTRVAMVEDVGHPGTDKIQEIVCRSEPLGLVRFNDGYIRYVIERRYKPTGELTSTEFITETAGPSSQVRLGNFSTIVGVRDASSVAEIAFAEDFKAEDADVLRLYWAFFDREPDLDGIKYWLNLFKGETSLFEQTMSLDAIADYFASSAEFQQRYGHVDSAEFVSLVYENVLSRDYDQDGFDYWLAKLEQHDLTRGEAVRWIAASPEFKGRHNYPQAFLPDDLGRWTSPGVHSFSRCKFTVASEYSLEDNGTTTSIVKIETPLSVDPESQRGACATSLREGRVIRTLTLNGHEALTAPGRTSYSDIDGNFRRTITKTYPQGAWDADGDFDLIGSLTLGHNVHGQFEIQLAEP